MGRAVGDGLRGYYKGKIEELELLIKDKGHNLRRLEAQRNELNAQGASSRKTEPSQQQGPL
jgi:26S proteasome regulatory subunit T6